MTSISTLTVEPEQFRSLMSTFPTGVAIVTTGAFEGEPSGLTVSSVSSVSLDPPTLLVCLNNKSRTLSEVLANGTFAVNLLHEGGQGAAKLFASGERDRFDRVEWENATTFAGPHLVNDAHSIADCRVSRTLSMGDHQVIFGEIFRVEQQSPEHTAPLLYGMRRFSAWPTAA
ncbi:flavin reductase family protein [Streptomyces sp. NPDC048436]|uniref:flavin reductase family protein n=1 Tax=Streptomyces sp. NPDC048436 TaxID=3365550 RepID=UPI00371DF631